MLERGLEAGILRAGESTRAPVGRLHASRRDIGTLQWPRMRGPLVLSLARPRQPDPRRRFLFLRMAALRARGGSRGGHANLCPQQPHDRPSMAACPGVFAQRRHDRPFDRALSRLERRCARGHHAERPGHERGGLSQWLSSDLANVIHHGVEVDLVVFSRRSCLRKQTSDDDEAIVKAMRAQRGARSETP